MVRRNGEGWAAGGGGMVDGQMITFLPSGRFSSGPVTFPCWLITCCRGVTRFVVMYTYPSTWGG